jgi:ribosomal-protein-serine acetyltransferase
MEITTLEKRPFNEILPGERINLVMPTEKYISLFWKSIENDKIHSESHWSWVQNEEQLKNFLEKKNTGFQSFESYYLISFNDLIIGSFNIHSKNYHDHKTEIGYAIAKDYEGKGLISEAIMLAERELKRLQFNKIVIICDQTNLRSIKVAERNGYMKEGMFTQDYVENGVFVNSIAFGKIIAAENIDLNS